MMKGSNYQMTRKTEDEQTSNDFLFRKLDTKKKQLARLEEQHKKLEVQATDKVPPYYPVLLYVL